MNKANLKSYLNSKINMKMVKKISGVIKCNEYA